MRGLRGATALGTEEIEASKEKRRGGTLDQVWRRGIRGSIYSTEKNPCWLIGIASETRKENFHSLHPRRSQTSDVNQYTLSYIIVSVSHVFDWSPKRS